jgi:hypothetical protein
MLARFIKKFPSVPLSLHGELYRHVGKCFSMHNFCGQCNFCLGISNVLRLPRSFSFFFLVFYLFFFFVGGEGYMRLSLMGF